MNKKTIKNTIYHHVINQDQPFNISLRQDLVCPVSVRCSKRNFYKVIATPSLPWKYRLLEYVPCFINKNQELLAAINNNKPSHIQPWLNAGANVNATDKFVRTPLHWAARKGHAEAVMVLLEKGAKMEAKDEYERTPLHFAAISGHAEMVKLLHEKGAEMEAKNKDRRTPLHSAAYHGHTKICEVLLAAKANPNSTDNYRRTPLHRAAEYGHVETVQALLQANADPKAKDKRRSTPLDLANANGHEAVINVLERTQALLYQCQQPKPDLNAVKKAIENEADPNAMITDG